MAGPSVAAGVVEAHTLRPHVMSEDGAQLIVLHLAEIGGLAAEGGNAGGGVAGRAAGDLDGLPHVGIERFGARLVDQVHRALDQPMPVDETVLDARHHVDDGIADAQDIDVGWS